MNRKEYKESIERLATYHDEWLKVRAEGTQNPFVYDGSQMNTYLRLIIAARNEIHHYCSENKLKVPTEYYFPVPELMPEKLMVNENELKTKAIKATALGAESSDYSELLLLKDDLKDSNLKLKIKYLMDTFEVLEKCEDLRSVRSELKIFTSKFESILELLTEVKNKLIEESSETYSEQEIISEVNEHELEWEEEI